MPRYKRSLSVLISMSCNVLQRPSAKELLQHRFVRHARRTSQLSELIDRYQEWHAKTPAKPSKGGIGAQDPLADEDAGGTVASAWAFETVRSQSNVEMASAEGRLSKMGMVRFSPLNRSSMAMPSHNAVLFLQQPQPDDADLAALSRPDPTAGPDGLGGHPSTRVVPTRPAPPPPAQQVGDSDHRHGRGVSDSGG